MSTYSGISNITTEWNEKKDEFVVEHNGRPMSYVSKEEAAVLFESIIKTFDKNEMFYLFDNMSEPYIKKLFTDGIQQSFCYSEIKSMVMQEMTDYEKDVIYQDKEYEFAKDDVIFIFDSLKEDNVYEDLEFTDNDIKQLIRRYMDLKDAYEESAYGDFRHEFEKVIIKYVEKKEKEAKRNERGI